MNKIKDYFNRYPQSNEVYETDGVLFHTEGAAQSFGKGEITKHTRQEQIVEEQTVEEPTKEEPKIVKLDYKTALSKCKELGLKLTDSRKETVFSALEAYNKQSKEE